MTTSGSFASNQVLILLDVEACLQCIEKDTRLRAQMNFFRVPKFKIISSLLVYIYLNKKHFYEKLTNSPFKIHLFFSYMT